MPYDTEAFLPTINARDLRSDRFRQFVKHLREQRFPIQSRIAVDTEVKAALRDEMGSKNFIRILERIITGGTLTQVNFDRLARIFYKGDSSALVRAFETSLEADFVASLSDVQSSFVKHAPTGTYILQAGTLLKGETGRTYLVQQRLRSNKPIGDSYKAISTDTSEPVFLKTLLMKYSTASGQIERVDKLFRREQTSLERLRDMKGIAHFLDYATADLTAENGITYKVPCLIQQYIPGLTLDIALLKEWENQDSDVRGIAKPEQWLDLTRQILGIISDVHLRGVTHGYIRPNNFMLWKGRIYLIDFAESSLLAPEASGNEKENKNDAYTSPQQRSNPYVPRDFSDDIYSLGATLFWMASGRDPAVQNERLKVGTTHRNKQLDLRKRHNMRDYVFQSVNPVLKAHNEGICHVICQCLHYKTENRVTHVDDAIRTLELFTAIRSETPTSSPTIRSDFALLKKSLRSFTTHALFADMIRQDIARVIRRAASMSQVGRVEVEGRRDELVTALLSYLSVLSRGDRYITVSTPSFWSSENLGVAGRFLSANKMLAEKGVVIRRLFAVSKSEARKKEFREIAAAQQSVIDSLRDHTPLIATDKSDPDELGYYVGVIRDLNDDQVQEIIQEGDHVGIIIKQQVGAVSLSFKKDDTQKISRMFIWNLKETQVKPRLLQVKEWLANSTPISEYAT